MRSINKFSSIIEYLAAAVIFVAVAFSLIWLLVGMGRTNSKLDNLNAATKCVDQISRVIKEVAISSKVTLYGIEQNEGLLKIIQIRDLSAKQKFVGIISIKPVQPGINEARIILKDPISLQYMEASLELEASDIKESLFTNLVKDTKLKSVSDCMGSGQVNQTVSPPFEFFKIKGAERVTAFTLDDAIYSASDNQVFSRLLIFESGVDD